MLWGAGILAISISGLSLPFMAYLALTGLSSLVTLYLGRKMYVAAWKSLLQWEWNTNTLYSISTLTILSVSILSLFIPGLPPMVEAAPFVLGFWHLGEGIEHTLLGKINKNLDVRDGIPSKVTRKQDSLKTVSVHDLKPDDIIFIENGDIIPVDGVSNSKVLLYTDWINGITSPKTFKPGDPIKSGMRLANRESELEMRVTKTYEESYVSKLANDLKKANEQNAINAKKAPLEILTGKILRFFIPGLLLVALASAVIIGPIFGSALAIQCVVSVLVSACPCALSLITPMAVKIGMKKTIEKGVYFNSGAALQAATDIDIVIFDLNATLTQGNVSVRPIDDSLLSDELLPYIALLESQSPHPAAKAIKSYALEKVKSQKNLFTKPLNISAIDKSHHSGIKAQINEEQFIIGNQDMLIANGIKNTNPLFNDPNNGSIYLVRGSSVVGQIALEDPLRTDAIATVRQLQHLGKKVGICSGSSESDVLIAAKKLGIPKTYVCANAVAVDPKPGEVSKTDFIKKLKEQGCKVAMVGDGFNDLSAMASADIGIAIKTDSEQEVVLQQAGMVIQHGLLYPIVTAFDIAKKTTQNISQNLFISLTYNSLITIAAAGLFVAIGFALNPVLGVALMVLESTLVLANILRLQHQSVLSSPPCERSINETCVSPNGTTKEILNALEKNIVPKPEETQSVAVNKEADVDVTKKDSVSVIGEFAESVSSAEGNRAFSAM